MKMEILLSWKFKIYTNFAANKINYFIKWETPALEVYSSKYSQKQ